MENSNLSEKLSVPISLDDVDVTLAKSKPSMTIETLIDQASLLSAGNVPMLESSIIQWLSTIWCANRSNLFDIVGLAGDAQLLSQLAMSAPGAVLALLPAGRVSGVNRNRAATFRKQFFEQQDRWPDLAVSDSAFLLCLDSYTNGGYPRQLYDDQSTGRVTDWDGFRLLVDKLINSVVEESNVRGEILSRANNISTILFELFKNTHDHARTGVDGSVIGDSVRGVYSRFYPIGNISETLKEKKGEPDKTDALSNYFRAMLKTRKETRYGPAAKRDLSGFLELSIFDTGPGMAARWLGRDVANCDPQEQYNAIIHCLSKGNSSSITRGRGFGLWRVLQELIKVKGFVRVRSNRVHVFRQYAMLEKLHSERHADGHETPEEKFSDWHRQYTSKLSEYPNVNGTLISIMIPMGEL